MGEESSSLHIVKVCWRVELIQLFRVSLRRHNSANISHNYDFFLVGTASSVEHRKSETSRGACGCVAGGASIGGGHVC